MPKRSKINKTPSQKSNKISAQMRASIKDESKNSKIKVIETDLDEKVTCLNHRNSIRIGLVGCVSSGKSTILNSICVKKYEDMQVRRTTMVPSVYMETNNNIYENSDDINQINSKNKEINQLIYEKDGDLKYEEISKNEYIIPKIRDFIDLPDNIYLDIYDIPGLNDAKSKDIYFKWIEANFSDLDIIFHVVDINSPLNTQDQIDILKMLIKNIENEKIMNSREVLLLTIINKCDEMEIDDGEFVFDEEDQENYDQIVKYTRDTINEVANDINNIKCEFTPLAAADAFVYRMLHNDPNVKLDMKLIQKFGINEVGKKPWSRMTEDQKLNFIKDHFTSCDISETLEITGYNKLKSKLDNYLTREKQADILISRLRKEINNETIINKTITKEKSNIDELISIYNIYTQKVYVIDILYDTNNSMMITELIYKHITRWINELSDLSNQNIESINRLSEYKNIIQNFIDKIDTYPLLNKLNINVDNQYKHRWGLTFGSSYDQINNTSSIMNIFKSMFSGYSKLQNEYYLNKLRDYNNYQGFSLYSFCDMIYENINHLRENSYDNIESIIDEVINIISDIIKGSHSPFEKNRNTPIYTYFEFIEGQDNTIVSFCKVLLSDYGYSKNKIIEFLFFYIKQRYNLLMRTQIMDDMFYTKHAFEELNMFKAYNILFDTWIKTEGPKLPDKYSDIMKNLFVINKSYMHYSNDLCIDYDYISKQNIILETPIYLLSLLNDDKSKGVHLNDEEFMMEIIDDSDGSDGSDDSDDSDE
jgi:hypothetical protein